MIEKDKNYTYKEIFDIFTTATSKAVMRLDNKMKETASESGKDYTQAALMFNLNNILAYAELTAILFNTESEE